MSEDLNAIQARLQGTRDELQAAIVALDPAAPDYQTVLNRILQGQAAFEQGAKALGSQLMDEAATTWSGDLYHAARVAIVG